MKSVKKHPEITAASLAKMYIEQDLPRHEIAVYFGVSVKTIGNRIQEYGLTKTGNGRLLTTKDKHLPSGMVEATRPTCAGQVWLMWS